MADKSLYTLLIDLKADTAKLQSDMDRAVGILQRSGSLMQNVFKGVFQGIGQTIGQDLLRNIDKLSSALTDLASKGDRAGDIAENFEKLGGSSSAIKQAQDAVLGTVSAFELMKAANDGLVRGIPNLNQNFAKMAEFANKFANATGQETLPVLDQLVKAVGTAAPKALQEFGIKVDATSSKSERMQQAIQGMSDKLGSFAPLTASVTQAHESFTAAIDEATSKVGMAINDNQQLSAVYAQLAETIRSIDWAQVGEGVASLAASFISLANSILPTIQNIEQFALGLEVALGTSARGKFLAIKEEIQELKRVAESFENSGRPEYAERATEYRQRIEDLVQQAAPLYEEMNRKVAKNNEDVNIKTNTSIVTDRSEKEDKAAKANAKRMAEAAKKHAEEIQKEQEDAYRQSIDTWTMLFDAAINGTTFNLESALKQVAVGFAAQMAQSIFGNIGGINLSNPFGSIGGMLAGSIMGTVGGGAAGAGTGLLGGLGIGAGVGGLIGSFGTTAAAAHGAGIAGPAMANGMFSSSSGILGALGPWGVGALVAGGLLAANHKKVGRAIGIGGGSFNPETNARRDMASWVEERTGSNFLVGNNSRFNQSGWAEDFKDKAGDSMKTFTALGAVIKDLSGVTEDVGDQFGYLLGENLQYNIDNARKMVKKLGLSFEEVEEKLVDMGIRQNQTWLQIETNIQGAAEAFKPGLSAMGAWQQAMENFINSGARGFDAVQSLRDIMIEAKEAGITSLDALRAQMLTTYDPKMVDQFFQALSQRGITSMDQLANASDRTAGGVVADMQALGFAFNEVAEGLNKINDEVAKFQQIMGESAKAPESAGEGEVAFARGGVVQGPTRALMGEAGPEAVLPLTRRNGKLGVSMFDNIKMTGGGGYVINIDARGADAGVENRIRSALRETEDRAIRRMEKSLRYSQRRNT